MSKQRKMLCTFCGKRIKLFFPSPDTMSDGFDGGLYFFCSKEHKDTWEKQEMDKKFKEATDA